MTTPPDAVPSLDGILEQAEGQVAQLAAGSLALEELVTAYEEAGRLLGEAEKRLGDLRERAAAGADR